VLPAKNGCMKKEKLGHRHPLSTVERTVRTSICLTESQREFLKIITPSGLRAILDRERGKKKYDTKNI